MYTNRSPKHLQLAIFSLISGPNFGEYTYNYSSPDPLLEEGLGTRLLLMQKMPQFRQIQHAG